MQKKRNLVVANWKMNPETLEEAKKIFNATRNATKELKNTEVVICPPSPFLSSISNLNHPKNLFYGAQDIFSEERGAFTGEVSAKILKNSGASFVIVGHSERRLLGETNSIIRKKIEIVFNNNLLPILCIGEKERDKEGTYLEFIKNQIKECLFSLPKKFLADLIIAYEPVWAIGKSYRESMNPTDIHEMTIFIKKIFGELFGREAASSPRVLYGGSVEEGNAGSIMEYGNVSGFLVGHASLIPDQFRAILMAADRRK